MKQNAVKPLTIRGYDCFVLFFFDTLKNTHYRDKISPVNIHNRNDGAMFYMIRHICILVAEFSATKNHQMT